MRIDFWAVSAMTLTVSLGNTSSFAAVSPRPLPLNPAPFERVGTVRQSTELLSMRYKAWVFGKYEDWAEYRSGDRSVMVAGEDQRLRQAGGYGYGAQRRCGFGRVGIYAGKVQVQTAGKYLLASIRILCPGEPPETDAVSTNDTMSVDRTTKTVKWSRLHGGRSLSYDFSTPSDGIVALAYDPELSVTVAEEIPGLHGARISHVPPSAGARGLVMIDLGEANLAREPPRPMTGGIDFWMNDAYHVPVRPTRNLLPNGGFEQALRSWNNRNHFRWQTSWDDILEKCGGSNLVQVVRTARSGNHALAFLRGNLETLDSVPVPIIPGRAYTVSWWTRPIDPGLDPRQTRQSLKIQTPGDTGWHWFAYDQTVRCRNAPDSKTPDANGWTRHAISFKATKGPGVAFCINGANVIFDDIQLEEGDAVTEFTTDAVNARIETGTKWRFLSPGQDVDSKLVLSGRAGLSGRVTVRVSDYFGESIIVREIPFTLDGKGYAEMPFGLDEAVAQPSLYFVRYDFSADGATWSDYSRFAVAEPLPRDYPSRRLFAGWLPDASALADDQMRGAADLGWGGTSWLVNRKYNGSKTGELYHKYGFRSLLHSVFSERGNSASCPHFADWKKNGGLAGCTNVTEGALQFVRELAYNTAKGCHTNDLWWAFTGEEEWIVGDSDERALAYAHYQKAARDGLAKAFRERGMRFYYAPTHGTVGGGADGAVPKLERYLRAAEKVGLRYDFLGVHMAWAIDEASVGSWEDREANHKALFDLMDRYGMKDGFLAQAETFYLLSQYIPEWDSVDWCDAYGGGLPSQAQGLREYLHAALLARMYLIDLESWPRILTSHPWIWPFTIDREITTYCWTHVPSAIGRLLPDPRLVGRHRPNPVIRGIVYRPTPDSKNGVLAIWSTDNDMERGARRGPVVRMRLPANTRFVDVMGGERCAERKEGVFEIPLTAAPLYVLADNAEALLESLRTCEAPKVEKVRGERYFLRPQLMVPVAKCGVSGPDWAKVASVGKKPTLKLAWNDDALFIRLETKAENIVRIGFDGLGNARRTSAEGLGPDDQVYDFKGREIFRIKETNTQYAHHSIAKPTEEEMRRDFRRSFTVDGESAVLELKIVPRFLSPITLKEGSKAGFAFAEANVPTALELGDPVDWMMLELKGEN